MFKRSSYANRAGSPAASLKTALQDGYQDRGDLLELPPAGAAMCRWRNERRCNIGLHREPVHIRDRQVMGQSAQTGAEACIRAMVFCLKTAKFAEALGRSGVAFIGPPGGCHRKDGDKITSKEKSRP